MDNRLCNLAWGTQLENMRDRDLHGKTAGGTRNAACKLQPEHVRDIRARREQGELVRHLAREFGVSCGHISKIATGKKWAGLAS